MCDQQILRSVCAYVQSDQSFCLSLEYPMSLRLLTEHHSAPLSLKGGCTGSSESTLVRMPHCWKTYVTAHITCIQLTVQLTNKYKEMGSRRKPLCFYKICNLFFFYFSAFIYFFMHLMRFRTLRRSTNRALLFNALLFWEKQSNLIQ